MNLDSLKDKLGLGPDKVYGVVGAFSEPEDLVAAGRKIREMGYTRLDAMSLLRATTLLRATGLPLRIHCWLIGSGPNSTSAAGAIATDANVFARSTEKLLAVRTALGDGSLKTAFGASLRSRDVKAVNEQSTDGVREMAVAPHLSALIMCALAHIPGVVLPHSRSSTPVSRFTLLYVWSVRIRMRCRTVRSKTGRRRSHHGGAAL